MNSLRLPIDTQSVAILGSEYCSGYIDLVGKWNTGFYCPSSEQTGSVFCCGSDNHKYCCTRKDEMMQEEMEGLSEVVGVMVGALTAILLLTIIFCVCCPWWPGYSKKNMDNSRGSMYPRPQHNSTARQVTTTHCTETSASGSTTGQDSCWSQQDTHNSHTLTHSLAQFHSLQVEEEKSSISKTDRRNDMQGHQSQQQPHVYNFLSQSSYLLSVQDTPGLPSETQEDSVLSPSQSMVKVNIMDIDQQDKDENYMSTKF